jgi:hypothetical protein
VATNTYPDDDNGDALRNMEASGDDLGKARDIDFSVAFTDLSSSAKFVEAAKRDGLRAKQEPDGATDSTWDVTVTSYMVPSYEAITLMERRLDKIASPLGGWSDGWGCFSVKG